MFLLFQGFQPLVLGVGFGTANLPSEVGGVKHKRWNFETSYRLDFTVNQSVLKFSGKPKLDSVGFNKKKWCFTCKKMAKMCWFWRFSPNRLKFHWSAFFGELWDVEMRQNATSYSASSVWQKRTEVMKWDRFCGDHAMQMYEKLGGCPLNSASFGLGLQ